MSGYGGGAAMLGVVLPAMTSGGHVAVGTAAGGTTFVPFAAQPCRQLTIANNTGVTVELQQGGGGAALPVFAGSYFTLLGLTDASTVGVRRVDQSTTQVSVTARWEA